MEMGFDGARVKRWQVILVREYFVMRHHFNVYVVGVKPRWMLTIGDNPNLAYPRRKHFNTPQRVHQLIEILKSKFVWHNQLYHLVTFKSLRFHVIFVRFETQIGWLKHGLEIWITSIYPRVNDIDRWRRWWAWAWSKCFWVKVDFDFCRLNCLFMVKRLLQPSNWPVVHRQSSASAQCTCQQVWAHHRDFRQDPSWALRTSLQCWVRLNALNKCG